MKALVRKQDVSAVAVDDRSISAAQLKYQSLKSKRDAAAREFNNYEQYCIKESLLFKVENPEKAIHIKAHVRRFFERVWAE